MATASIRSVCAICGENLPSAGQDCPSCHASAAWQDLLKAAQFVQDRLLDWDRDRVISRSEFTAMMQADNQLRDGLKLMAREGKPIPTGIGLLPRDRCWQCGAELGGSPAALLRVRRAGGGPSGGQLRYWRYLCRVIKSHCEARRLPLAQAHARIDDAKGRIAVLAAALEKQRQPIMAHVVKEGAAGGQSLLPMPWPICSAWGLLPPRRPARPCRPSGRAPPPQPAPPRTPRRPLWEILLDPRSIQWLLGFGGALLVMGLVIWLATLGIFKHAAVVAVALGLANAALLGGGWLITLRSRYQTAGRALTLLACLVMPLNLYFYHAYDLIKLDGHLWLAALVCTCSMPPRPGCSATGCSSTCWPAAWQ